MTQDDIIRMANSINEDWWLDDMDLEVFAQLVAAAEREACAQVLDGMAFEMESDYEPTYAVEFVREKAAAIRARGKR